MNCMATLKHISSKNSDYTAIEAYLVYQHDAFTGKQLLDEQGRPKLRESYLLDTLECGDFSFATACLLANRKYGKNTQHGDIKSHQYIISFDPRDAADNGLTMEKAQALGLKFCSENFPGHPAIVCTHPDGHNHSGNIHVHIVIGSVRTREVERKPYMQKPRDWLEGMKHSSTAQTIRYLRVEVMELCEGAGLYQIDLLNGSKERVREAEYWARRRGQLKLDRENAALTAAGQPPRQKKFETVKDTLRKQISSVLYRTTSFEEFSDRLMQQYSITVKESRGQLSYLPAGRTKFIRAKHLGDKFDKAAVLATLQANVERKPKRLSPLIVWGNTLVDGHNRYAILQKHPEIYFSTMPLPFESREEAIAWICRNQLGRRNLSPEQKRYLLGKQYEAEKKVAKIFRGNQYTLAKKSGGDHGDNHHSGKKTCDRIAEENGVSRASVLRASHYTRGIDIADNLSPGIKQKVFSGEVKFTSEEMSKLVQASVEHRSDVLAQILHPEALEVLESASAEFEPEKAELVPMPTPQTEEFRCYHVPDEFMKVYKSLSRATEMMKNSWKKTLKNNPSYFTDPEKQKVLRFAMQRPANYLTEIETYLEKALAEALEEEKTA